MLRSLAMFLALRRLNGRHVSVLVLSDDGTRPWANARATLAGLWGVAPDGDDTFVPWADVTFVKTGAGVEASYTRLRTRAGALRVALAEGLDPLEVMMRAASAGRGGIGPDEPALGPDEIAAILATDERRNEPLERRP